MMDEVAILCDRLAVFDGRSVAPVAAIQAELSENAAADALLIACLTDTRETVGDAATWVLRARIETGHRLNSADTEALTRGLPRARGWAGQLHLCQLAARLELTPGQARRWARWAVPLATHARPFLRAWALDCLWVVAPRSTQARRALDAARTDDAASVRARARAIDRRIS